MAINNQLVISDLDFDSAKQNFINWLSGQAEFSDYNFSGAGLQVLLDVLAYNTHYNAFYHNMISNEITISTAQVHDNIVKLAKALNYVPSSMSSATAFINILVTPTTSNNNPSTLLLPSYTPFISQSVNGTNFNFVTTQAYIASYNGNTNTYNFSNVKVNEGNVINYNYSASSATGNTFNIPNANVDTTTLTVNVIETANTPSQTLPYTLCQDITVIDGNTRVYFLEGSDNFTYNIYFGDNILGRQLNGGDTVSVTYLNTNGPLANFANNFTLMNPLGAYSNVITQATGSASGGSLAEDDASIKYHAPISHSTQNRALTLQDYNEILLKNYRNISSLNIWSGSTNNPPLFGKTMISIKPPMYDYLSQTEKQNVINILSVYNMPTIGIIMVDADFTYVLVNVEVNYNPKLTSLSQADLINAVTNTIYNYSNLQLNTFKGTFRESSLDQFIVATDPSILGVATTLYLQKRLTPILNMTQTYTLNYYTALKQGSLNQNIFSSPNFRMNDKNGILQTCFIEENIGAYQGVSDILINNPGFGFTGQPQIIISGDGSGALAHAVIVNQTISSIIIDNPGTNYTFVSAQIVGGSGYGAVITPILTASTGILQTYYISNSNKFTLNANQGTIDYVNGVITLNNFNPVSVSSASSVLSINAPPSKSLILPSRNNIMQIDSKDPSAVQVTLVPQS